MSLKDSCACLCIYTKACACVMHRKVVCFYVDCTHSLGMVKDNERKDLAVFV